MNLNRQPNVQGGGGCHAIIQTFQTVASWCHGISLVVCKWVCCCDHIWAHRWQHCCQDPQAYSLMLCTEWPTSAPQSCAVESWGLRQGQMNKVHTVHHNTHKWQLITDYTTQWVLVFRCIFIKLQGIIITWNCSHGNTATVGSGPHKCTQHMRWVLVILSHAGSYEKKLFGTTW